MNSMKKVAFVTYNNMGDDLDAGWYERDGKRALIITNSKGRRSAAFQPLRWSASEVGAVNREVTDIWDMLDQVLPELDHIVVYVGANGSEEAIRRAAAMPPEKVTFVLCDCNMREKERMICTSGMSTTRKVMCECGGRHTMRALFERYIKSGTV